MIREILAIIPARGGSRGVPNKNIAPLAGKPLIAWTIEAALASRFITRVVVSSDSAPILSVARQYGAEVLTRPAGLASDTARSEPVVAHCLAALKAAAGYVPEVVVLLQPTSPLRAARDIDAALELLDDGIADSVISVSEPPHSPYKCLRETSDGFLQGLVDDEAPFKRRQDLPRALQPNGAIYAIRTVSFEGSGKLLTRRTRPYEMGAKESLDIDTGEDLVRAEQALKARAIESIVKSTFRAA
jgi:CMP-N-acetylneuraminic acid synthetase